MLVVGLLAIVQFGILSSNLSCIKLASRGAADVASTIPLPSAGGVPAAITEAGDELLRVKGIDADGIRVEHNVDGNPPVVLSDGTTGPPPTDPTPTTRPYARVTVYVDQSKLAPNLLRSYCIDLRGRVAYQTTTRCYP